MSPFKRKEEKKIKAKQLDQFFMHAPFSLQTPKEQY
jgi:hypothetical protein